MWDLPEDFEEDDISHFTVTVNNEEHDVRTETSTSYTMCDCEPHNVTITFTDRCGRTGSTTSVITLNTTQPLFECDLPTTANTATTPNNEDSRFDLNSKGYSWGKYGTFCTASPATLVIQDVLIL